MKLTIEIGSAAEVEQLLQVFSTMNLETIHVVVDNHVEKKPAKGEVVLKAINRPIQKRLDLEALKRAKNYKGVNRERFDRLVKEINIVEPIELLMSQLSR